MAQSGRIEELRKRLEREPGSPLFAQYAEELRRAGELGEAIRVCREGLGKHPGYATARITLARALATSGDAAGARAEFEAVVRASPDNVIAKRGIEELGSDGARAWGDKSAGPAVVAGAAAAPPDVGSAAGPRGVAEAAAAQPVAAVGTSLDGSPAASPVEGPPSGEDEDYELEPLRPAAPPGPPQLTFRPLLDEEESQRAAQTAGGVARGVGGVPAELGAPSVSPSEVMKRPREEKPAGVELASPTLAELYFEQGSFERAAQIYEELLGREPTSERLATRLREAHARIGTGPDRGHRGSREELLRRGIARLQELRSRFRRITQSGRRGADA